jgi:type IV pilus assembly protein PilV
MALHANLNEAGFTLIEFLVAIVIMMVGLLGLLQTVNLAYSHNLVTEFRNEAVMLADEQMVIEKSKGFDLISTGTTNVKSISRNFRSASKTYTVTKVGSVVGDLKAINITISWTYKGTPYSSAIYSVASPKE